MKTITNKAIEMTEEWIKALEESVSKHSTDKELLKIYKENPSFQLFIQEMMKDEVNHQDEIEKLKSEIKGLETEQEQLNDCINGWIDQVTQYQRQLKRHFEIMVRQGTKDGYVYKRTKELIERYL